MTRLFVIGIFLVAAGALSSLVIDGLRTGGVGAVTGGRYSVGTLYKIERRKDPLQYWGLMGMYFAALLFNLFLLVLIVFFIPSNSS